MAHHYADSAQAKHVATSDMLYERYGKPLEVEHRGKYLAVSREGRTLLAPTLLDIVGRAAETLGPEPYIFKVGDKAVGKWLWLPSVL